MKRLLQEPSKSLFRFYTARGKKEVKALKTGTKALVILTILLGALATSVIALPTFADPIRDRDQLQDQDQLRDRDKLQTCETSLMERGRIQNRTRLQTCEGNGDGNCTRTYNCACNCAGGSNQGTGMQECFQWQFGTASQGEGAAMHRYGSCGSMNKGK